MRPVLVLLLLFVASLAMASGLQARTLAIGARERTYQLYIPDNAEGKKNRPLVIMLHGRGGKGADAAKAYGWMEKANQEGIIVAFPDAMPDPYQNIPTWNYSYDPNYKGADDVTFLLMLIINLKREFTVDPKRVFVAGHSNGAMMAYRAASELSDIVAAIAPVAGSLGPARPGLMAIKKPRYPVSVMAVHGLLDKVVPYAGASSIGAKESVGFWIKQNECSPSPAVEKLMDDELVIETHGNGKNGTEVVMVTVGKGGHEWPGWIVRRWDPRAAEERLTATDMIWEFFATHPKRA
jgi:polyhydroxybutyrate depolymerase